MSLLFLQTKLCGKKIVFGCTKIIKKNAETADYSQNTQTGWECGDDANFVVYATIPARFI